MSKKELSTQMAIVVSYNSGYFDGQQSKPLANHRELSPATAYAYLLGAKDAKLGIEKRKLMGDQLVVDIINCLG